MKYFNKDKWIEIEGEPSIAHFARKHNLPKETVYSRYKKGERNINKLIRPPESRGKEILWGGKTSRKWHFILCINGINIRFPSVQSFYYRRKNVYKETPEQALKQFKKHHRLK